MVDIDVEMISTVLESLLDWKKHKRVRVESEHKWGGGGPVISEVKLTGGFNYRYNWHPHPEPKVIREIRPRAKI